LSGHDLPTNAAVRFLLRDGCHVAATSGKSSVQCSLVIWNHGWKPACRERGQPPFRQFTLEHRRQFSISAERLIQIPGHSAMNAHEFLDAGVGLLRLPLKRSLGA
jgi:hypothetical protein